MSTENAEAVETVAETQDSPTPGESTAADTTKAQADATPAVVTLTADEYKALHDKLNSGEERFGRLEKLLEATMSEKDKERLRAISAKEAAEKQKADVEKQARDKDRELSEKIERIEGQLTKAKQVAMSKDMESTIAGEVQGLAFVGSDHNAQRKAAATFGKLVRESMKTVENEDGTFSTVGIDGRPAREVVASIAEEHDYLIARKGRGGVGSPGAPIPRQQIEDETRRHMAEQANSRSGRATSLGLWGPNDRN